MDFAVADDTIGFGHEPAVGSSVPRRYSVTLHTGTITGLFKQAFIGGAMRLVTFGAAFTFYEVVEYHGVFIREGSGIFGVTVLAGPVNAGGPEGAFEAIAVVAVDALNIIGDQRVSRAQVEFRDHGRVTTPAEIFSFRIHQVQMGIVVNLVAGRALHSGDGMRVVGAHGRLMRSLMTAGTNHGLVCRGRVRPG